MAYEPAQDTPIIPITAGAALTKGQLVKLSTGTVVANTGSDVPFGVLLEDVANGGDASVYVCSSRSIVYLDAHDNAITQGMFLVAAAAGRVDGAGATGTFIGKALEASTAQGHLIKCILFDSPYVVA